MQGDIQHVVASLVILATVFFGPVRVEAQAPRIRDSAGVRVMETPARSKAPVAFALGAPSLDLGGLKPNPDDEFSRFGVLRNMRFSDGSIVAADEGRLRFYDSSGRQVRVVGRKGQGPGEFERLGSMCITRGDTLVAGDDANRRFTILDKTGKIIREFSVGRMDLLDHACLDDGTFITSESGPMVDGERTNRVIRHRIDGSIVDTLGDFWAGRFNTYTYFPVTIVARGNRIYVSDQRYSEVKILDPSGKLVAIVRTSDPIEKVTAAEAEAMAPMGVGAGPGAVRPTPRPKPTEWPSFSRIDVDEAGRLWIEDYRKRPDQPNSWTAFDRDGRMLGKFAMPAVTKVGDPRIRFFTRDGVLIRRQDDDGAEHLTTYRLVPVAGGH